jgi:hypothetical protein
VVLQQRVGPVEARPQLGQRLLAPVQGEEQGGGPEVGGRQVRLQRRIVVALGQEVLVVAQGGLE